MKIELMSLYWREMIHYFLDLTSQNAKCISMSINDDQTMVNKMKLGGGTTS
ncbi:hypothetical protein SanaruYs_00450 [Chryseotalea sanaruensis]|uniref:Uncharacterized protein n=1 Tax=Chryseotalea sanaruensis TaxID=2482724 RepID=A0A401U4L1_9BACT|nr:hypothetical protein SanaruYs_00450 [Chryseotalea sanaruensis]